MKLRTIATGLIVFFFCIVSDTKASTTDYSIVTGNYTTIGVWSTIGCGGASCGCTPGSDIVICSGTTVTFTGAFVVGPGGNVSSLTINSGGTFITTGDMEFKNGSTVTVAAGGSLQVGGDFTNDNNSKTITINGSMSVAGSATFGNGSTVTGTGSVNVTGSASGAGTVYGTSPLCSGCVLPVVLTAFTAQYYNSTVSIAWTTATEKNNKYYTVERTTNGSDYSLLTSINGAGTSTTSHSYNVTDPSPENGINYYRLSQTDLDGTTTYLGVITVEVNLSEQGLKVFPDPAKNSCSVSFTDDKPEQCTLSVYDYMGKEILNSTVQTVNGSNTAELNITSLPAGIYFISIPVKGQLLKTKFIKN